ncbi:hypothetical protein [Brevundimonas sp.]|uniref:hypothetical protein n=1 Tax=Brevundimonas sp. TaxID=1871086 RepID=UPI002D27D3FA|nr:hypothetical protein [Brevundimonas sp.]HYC99322.1 hypothetical protein [Brevundimonas sp.]
MRRIAVLMLASLSLAACGERADEAAPTPAETKAETVSAIGTGDTMFEGGAYEHQLVEKGVRVEGLPDVDGRYFDVRARLLKAGFQPVDTNSADSERFKVCPEEFQTGQIVGACSSQLVVLPEVEACAGAGLGPCRLAWRAPDGRMLTVFTAGEPQPGVVSGVEWGAAA